MERREQGGGAEVPVVVVEDDRDTREMLCELLAEAGCKPLRAYNGREAMLLLRSLAPRFVVLDLAMPEMSGWDVVAAMKRDDTLAPVPVVVVSSRPLSASGLRRSDVAAYLQKPIDPDRFAWVVEALRRVAATRVADPYSSKAAGAPPAKRP